MPPANPKLNLPRFAIHYAAKAKFDEYAAAAKTEIGGLMRVKVIDGLHVCLDVKPLPQEGTSSTFELNNPMEHIMGIMQEKGADEAQEWFNIVHSHPNNTAPFLSGVDHPNLVNIAGERHAWSLIMTRKDLPDTESTNYKVHLAVSPKALGDGNTFFTDGLVVQDLPVEIYHPEREAIRAEVKELIKEPPRTFVSSYSPGGSGGSYGYSQGYQKPQGGYTPPPASQPYSTPQNVQKKWGWEDDKTKEVTNDHGYTESAIEQNLNEFVEKNIDIGAVVRFVPTPVSFSLADDEDARAALVEMANQEFVVTDFQDGTGRAILDHPLGLPFDPDELELVTASTVEKSAEGKVS